MIHIENHTNGEEPVVSDKIKKYGKYSAFLAVITLIINPFSIALLSKIMGMKILIYTGFFWISHIIPWTFIFLAFILGFIARKTNDGKIGLFSSIIIGTAFSLYILIIMYPPFY